MGLGCEQRQLHQWPSPGPELERSTVTQQAAVPVSVLLRRAELAVPVAPAGLAALDGRGEAALSQRGGHFALVFIVVLVHLLQHAAELQFQLPHPLEPSGVGIPSVVHSSDF